MEDNDLERRLRDKKRRRLARANTKYFDSIHPSLVEKGLDGKFVLIDNESVWGASKKKRRLNRCYEEVHIEGGFEVYCPQIYQVNAKEAEEQLAIEKEREKEKTRKARARAKGQSKPKPRKKTPRKKPESEELATRKRTIKKVPSKPKSKPRYRQTPNEDSRSYEPACKPRQAQTREYSPQERAGAREKEEDYRPAQRRADRENKPEAESGYTKPERPSDSANRKVYKGKSLRSSNKNTPKKQEKPKEEKDKMAKDKKSKKGNGKGERSAPSETRGEAPQPQPPQRSPQDILNDFKGLYKDYGNSRNIQRGVQERGSQIFDEPNVYDALVAKEAGYLAGTKYASVADRLHGVSEGGNDSLPKDHLKAIADAWYSGSRNLLAGFCLSSGNLEAILAQAPEDKIRKVVPQYLPPQNAQGHEELAGLHGSYLRSAALLSQYQNAETRKDKLESTLAVRAEAEAAVMKDVESESNENAKAYLMAFARIAGRNSAVAEGVASVVVKERKETFENKLGSYGDVRGYFGRMTDSMKTKVAESDMLFDALYQVSP
jgi:hypothetical protein